MWRIQSKQATVKVMHGGKGDHERPVERGWIDAHMCACMRETCIFKRQRQKEKMDHEKEKEDHLSHIFPSLR